ncbi:hypothetical protein, partial [Stieleria sp.]|uniref:hypothetical protein n=1 Tax=Stieleria sp. TaxID=2795976 RepID=UPI00356173DA
LIQLLAGGAIIGAVLSLIGAAVYSGGSRRVMLAYLVAFAFVLSLSLGSLFFVLIGHLMRAGWNVLVRRPAEIFGLNIVTVAVLFLPIALSVVLGGELYPWAKRDAVESPHPATPVALNEPTALAAGDPQGADDHHSSLYVHQTVDELTRSKQGWLNPTAFIFRSLVFFGIWTLIAWFYFSLSRHQDSPAGGEDDTRQMEWWAGVSVFAFGITLTYAAFDMLMSIDPHWYSTIYGVYFFAGCAVGGFSINLLAILLLQRFDLFPVALSDEHRRDLGRLLFAFVFFWGYIAFSQYMLLWYANVPETTRWFVVRGASMAEGYTNSWGYLLVLLLFGHFIIPFLGIMSRHVKTNPNAMIFWTGWLLVMHYFDLYWLVMPELGPHLTFGLPEIGTLLFALCVYLLGASMIATRTALVPTGDPRLSASVAITDAY